MNTIHERIELLINTLNLNKNSFAKAVGTSATVIQNILGPRQSKPGFDLLSKIAETFDINSDWLLLGQGSMLKEQEQPHQEKQPSELLQRFEEIVAENALLKAKLAEYEKGKG